MHGVTGVANTIARPGDLGGATKARPSAAWMVYLAVGVAAIATYYALPRAGLAQGVLLTVLNGTAAAAAYRTAAVTQRQTRRLWTYLGLAMTLSTLANGPYYGFPLVTGRPVPFPCPVDAFWLLTFPSFVAALRVLTTARRRSDRPGDALDSMIIVVAAAAAMWRFVIGPVVNAEGLPLLAHAVSVAYPVMDLLVFAMLVRFVVAVSRRSPTMRLLLGSFVALLAADVLYARLVATGSYAFGGPTDGLWMASYLLIGVAALHPSARSVRTTAPAPNHRVSPGRLAFLSAAVLTGPLMVIGSPKDLVVVAASSAVSFVLVMARLTGLNRELANVGAEMETRASTDSLTGLANRSTFVNQLQSTLAGDETRPGSLAVLFIDLDDFKDVNDTSGHAAGDEVLRVVADRLRGAVRPHDLVARLGGDEFAVLLAGLPQLAIALDVAQRAVDALAAPLDIGARSVHVGASAGLAFCRDASSAQSLMREADVAMYTAKSQGKNRAAMYDATLEAAAIARQALKVEIGAAARQGELVVDYQPVVDLASGRIAGLEALVRWQHPTLGLLPPSAFIELAEQTGAIASVGAWVLDTATAQVRSWQRLHERPDLWLSVNVSACQLDTGCFAEQVAAALHASGLAPSNLVVEITESQLLKPSGEAAASLWALHRSGVKVAIDDFGTGYSSISHLGRLPIDIVKIDRSFVSDDSGNGQGEALLGAVVDLANRLELAVIPEGIEEGDQLARLQELGCRVGQGFLMSRPASPSAIDRLLADRSSLLPADPMPFSGRIVEVA